MCKKELSQNFGVTDFLWNVEDTRWRGIERGEREGREKGERVRDEREWEMRESMI